jgi:hypothetical protein
MNRTLISAAVALTMAVAPVAASAQAPGGPMMRPSQQGMMPQTYMMQPVYPPQGVMGPGMMGPAMMGPGMMGGMRMMMILMDTDGDGALSLEEVQAVHARLFEAVDDDGNGRVTPEEIEAFMHGETESPPEQQ